MFPRSAGAGKIVTFPFVAKIPFTIRKSFKLVLISERERKRLRRPRHEPS